MSSTRSTNSLRRSITTKKIDHNQHAALLETFGLDPGQLAEKAAKEGLTKL